MTAPQHPSTAPINTPDQLPTNRWYGGPYSFEPPAQQPLANSMYAAGTNDQISYRPQTINEAAEMNQLTQRIDQVERYQFQEGLTARFNQVSTARQLRNLQTEQAKDIKILEMRITVFGLQAKLIEKENEERTRLIKIEPRTQAEKLESAMKNRSLNRIASGDVSPDLTPVQGCIRAAQMDKLAKLLRSRVYIRGAEYILEAEDAEAWASKLRKDADATESEAESPVTRGRKLAPHQKLAAQHAQVSKAPDTQIEVEVLKTPVPVPETDNVTSIGQGWQPAYIKALPCVPAIELQVIPSHEGMHYFNRSFLLTQLGGTSWSPSFYHVPEPERSLLPDRGYFILEAVHEPLGPITPGAHGSLLTPILRLPEVNNPTTPKPESMQNAPLFVKHDDGYVYYGMYTFLRADRLDIERCDAVVPSHLKDFWAEQLTSTHRPKWVTEALQKHLLPQPTYTGPLPGHADEDQVNAGLSRHMTAMEAWQRDTHVKTAFLRPENILAAFSAPDTGAEMPGIRFWNMGLRCDGWDEGFYDMMVREEGIWKKNGSRDGEGERARKEEMMTMLRSRSKRPKKW
ncbi:hypothetical protein D6C81_04900 [Aureobasidium pullulans]|nr:hypothetical protein D6C81_04900 [Aureobasidium pullulans]